MAAQADAIRNAIERANEQFMDAFGRGDAAGVAALYTEDAKVLPPNHDVVRGQPAIRSFWQGLMDTGVKAVRLEIGEAEQQGDTAYEVSRATLLGAGDQVLDEVKYIAIWNREGAAWRLHRDIFNSSRPVH